MNMHQQIAEAEDLVAKQHILVLSGLPAAGKTYEALNWLQEDAKNRTLINYREIKKRLYGDRIHITRPEMEAFDEEVMRVAVEAIGAGKSICIDHTNLTPKERLKWATLGKASACPVEMFEVPGSIEDCINRDRQRGDYRVGRAYIERLALDNGFIDWNDGNLYQKDFIVFDMDGTLANHEWRVPLVTEHCLSCGKEYATIPVQTPGGVEKRCLYCSSKAGATKKDWDTFFNSVGDDEPFHDVLEMARALSNTYDILVVTGRAINLCGIQTEEWIRQHMADLPVRHLFMPWARSNDFTSKDEIINMLPIHRIAASFDDRNRSVEVWRKHGVRTYQVAPGNY